MNIGIITLSSSYNCGSMLQCYALKKTLDAYGKAEVINFCSEKSKMQYDILPHGLAREIMANFRYRRMTKLLKNEQGAYELFKTEMLKMNSDEVIENDVRTESFKYDVLVVGSDQVWNYKMNDFSEAFLLGWYPKKKISYAASLGGVDLSSSKNVSQYIKWINEFSNISVRESAGADSIKKMTNKDVPVVLDPTLLVDSSNWTELIGPPLVRGEYIFYYSWAYCYEELLELVKAQSRIEEIPVYVFDAHKWRYANSKKLKKFSFKLCDEGGPLAFLNLMYYAKECYVESFHGTIFATIFEKDFWVLSNSSTMQVNDTRLNELLKMLGLEDRVLCPATEKNAAKIDFEKVKKRIENERIYSFDYLDKALGDKVEC